MTHSKIDQYVDQWVELSSLAFKEAGKIRNTPVSEGGRGRAATLEEAAVHFSRAAYYQAKANENLLLAMREEYLDRK